MNKKLYPLYLCVLTLCAISVRAQTTTTTTTTAPAAPATTAAPATPTPAAVAGAPAAPAAPAAAPTSPVSTPAMEGPLTVNLKPESFDIPDFGKIYISGALTGLGLAENYPFPGDRRALADVSNAQVFAQKVDGTFQFFVQGGVYSLPSLGAGYLTSGTATNNLYGPLPMAFIKIAPTSNFSVEAGKLPTLVGAEYTFTYENMNIERGLLWNQETAISRGVQVNYTAGPVALSASWNDGFYSNRFNWLSGSAAWTINSSNTLAVVISGNAGTTDYGSAATPQVQNNDSQLDNLIYTYTSGAWLAQAYYQYADSKSGANVGFAKDASSSGAGILMNYAVPNSSFNLSGRVEYISTNGSPTDGTPNILYGPGSKAWSFTFTPTYQVGVFFARAEISLVQASSTTSGMALGSMGTNRTQSRVALETGILF